jgi:hypothetical protein
MSGIVIVVELGLILLGAFLLFLGFVWLKLGRLAGLFGIKAGHQYGFAIAVVGGLMLGLGMFIAWLFPNPEAPAPRENYTPVENVEPSDLPASE